MTNMKKFFAMLLMVILVLSPVVYVDAKTTKKTTTTTTSAKTQKEPVNVYVFYGETCPHCESLHTYLDSLKDDKTVNYMFEVVDYEVWSNETNYNLMLQVGEYFEADITGVPFYVVGEKYYSGFGDSSQDSLLAAIKEAYNNTDYKDIVAGIGTGEISGTASENDDSKKANDKVGMIILGITVVIVIILIVSSSKNKYYDDEDEENDEEEQTSTKNISKSEEKVDNSKKNVKSDTKKSSKTKTTNNKSTATKSKAKTTKNTKTSKK